MENRIERSIELKAPVARVWLALTDYRQFGEWFRVQIDGPFEVGGVSRGHMTYPGFEYMKWDATIVAMEPERLFSYTWHPYPADPNQDYSQETPTLVEFRLEPVPGGTLLVVTETGFDHIPSRRRDEAFSMHEGGWDEQLTNIETYLAEKR